MREVDIKPHETQPDRNYTIYPNVCA